MSKNIKQIYDTNPITTVPDDGLFYCGLDPYDPTDDAAIKKQDLFAQIVIDVGTNIVSSDSNINIAIDENDQIDLTLSSIVQISERLAVGTSSDSVSTFRLSSTTEANSALFFGIKTAVDNLEQAGLRIHNIFQPSVSCNSVYAGNFDVEVRSPGAGNIFTAYALRGFIESVLSTVDTVCGVYGGAQEGFNGVSTRAYSVWGGPSEGTYKASGAFEGGVLIGSSYVGTAATTTAPTNGLLVEGNTSIGSPTSTSLFNVGSANQFRVDSTGQIVAMGSPLSVSFGGTGTATAFTVGSVVFAGVGGVYTQDTTNFAYDDANNLLRLNNYRTIAGTAAGALTSHWALTTSAGVLRWGLGLQTSESGGNTGSNFRIFNYDDSGSFLSTALTFERSNNALGLNGSLAIGSSFFASTPPANSLIVEGQIGVRTTSINSSSVAFQVGGASSTASGIALDGAAASEKKILYYSAGGGLFSVGINGSSTSYSISDFGTGTARFLIDSAGKIAIGATSATYQLDVVGGDIGIMTVGSGLAIKEGANGRCGVVTMVGGTAVVSMTNLTATSRVICNRATNGGTLGQVSVIQTAGVGFTVTSSSATETSTYNYLVVEGF